MFLFLVSDKVPRYTVSLPLYRVPCGSVGGERMTPSPMELRHLKVDEQRYKERKKRDCWCYRDSALQSQRNRTKFHCVPTIRYHLLMVFGFFFRFLKSVRPRTASPWRSRTLPPVARRTASDSHPACRRIQPAGALAIRAFGSARRRSSWSAQAAGPGTFGTQIVWRSASCPTCRSWRMGILALGNQED